MSRALTTRQRQVLALVDRGLSNKEIAHRLGITLKTVKNHVTTINAKIPGASRETRASQKPKPTRALVRCPFCERRFDWETNPIEPERQWVLQEVARDPDSELGGYDNPYPEAS